MIWLAILAIVVLIIFGVISLFSGQSEQNEKSPYQYLAKKLFLTRAEHECYDALIAAVGNEYHIFAQVHLGSILDETVRGQNWKAARSHIDRKSIDFLLCDKNYISPKLAIELDDKSHQLPQRQIRDTEVERILREAGIPLLRLQNHGHFGRTELSKMVRESIG